MIYKEPHISIITVTYNATATIGRTLDSVAYQEFDAFEHLIIDGQSTDGTMLQVEAYKRDNPDRNIRIVSEPDKGLYDAMNKGIRLAQGKYIVFLNAGDQLHSIHTLYYVNREIEACEKEGKQAGVVYGQTDIVDGNGEFVSHRHLNAPDRLTWKSFRKGMVVCHQSFYALKSIVSEYDLRYRFSADFDWCIRVMKKAEEEGLALVNTCQTLTDFLEGGLSHEHHKSSLKERYRIMCKYYGWASTTAMHGWFFARNLKCKVRKLRRKKS